MLESAHHPALSDDDALEALDSAAVAPELTELTELEAAVATIENLKQALIHARTIGMAIGILIERERVTPEVAFTRLRRVSQTSNRKLWKVAESFVLTGSLDPIGR